MFKKALVLMLILVTFCLSCLTSCNISDIFGNNTDGTDGGNGTNGENGAGSNENGTEQGGETEDSGESDVENGGNTENSIPVPDRFKTAYTLDREKLEAAADAATEKLLKIAYEANGGFPGTCSTDFQYKYGANNNWTCGMYTGSYLMAYQLTGDERFREIVMQLVDSFIEREENRVGMDDHDVGFVFVPSCVGAYKVFGSEDARDAALRAVQYYYATSYSQQGKFIIRSHRSWDSGSGCRTMMDSMMNATLFFWAWDYAGNANYYDAGASHTNTTVDLLVREDGSTYHHYQFDPKTAAPLYGLTWQGYSDESCWSRGHSWGVYGFSIAYSYTRDVKIQNAQRDLVYYMLNRLPEDNIPYWDYVFTDGTEPRDASAAAISVCGLLDMAEMLPEGSEERIIYESAAAQMMEALIDLHTTEIDVKYDGLIHGVTHAKPQGQGIEECAAYADYFYLEALARYLADDFIRPW